jgi:hypothetical protein
MEALLETVRGEPHGAGTAPSPGEGDYWREKAAAKLAAFLDIEQQFLSRLAELREEYPDLADALEARKRHLAALTREARAMYAEWQSGSTIL